MKKIFYYIVNFVLLIVVCSSCILSVDLDNAITLSNSQEILRIHILANSNSQEDMDIKYQIRESLIDFLSVNEYETKEEMINYLTEEKDCLNVRLEDVLIENNLNYGVEIAVEPTEFPIRRYGQDIIVDEGVYDSIIITLGEGEGDNWWCIAFPNFCSSKKAIESEEVTIKSRFKEWVEKIKNWFS